MGVNYSNGLPCVACDEGPVWMRHVLRLAAVYNVLWGGLVVLLPAWTLGLIGVTRTTPMLEAFWACIGMIVGVYGVGYWVASADPIRHWPIVLVGLMGKVFGPIGFAMGWLKGDLPGQMAWTIVFNDLVWWVPFGMMLWAAARLRKGGSEPMERLEAQAMRGQLRASVTHEGRTLMEMSETGPGQVGLLLVFVRHMGCTFCREMLSDLAAVKDRLQQAGVQVAVVHQSEEAEAAAVFERYGLEAQRVSDVHRQLYRAFGLGRGTFGELFGWRVVQRGFGAWRHGVGMLQGDGFQMPGVFGVRDGEVIEQQVCAHAGERMDLERFLVSLQTEEMLSSKTDELRSSVMAGTAS